MSKLLAEDALWERVEPLLPTPKLRRFRCPGRKSSDNRAASTSILFVFKTGLPWNDLPREIGCGHGAACWAHLHEWHALGAWAALHATFLAELRYIEKIEWCRAAVDAMSIRAWRGGDKTGKTPTDRSRKGTKDHLLIGGGIPPAAHAAAANRHDVTQLRALVEEILPGAGNPAAHAPDPTLPWRIVPMTVNPTENGCKSAASSLFSKRGTAHGGGLGVHCYIVERAFAWFEEFRRLQLRYERGAFMHEVVLNVAMYIVCFRRL